MFTVQVATLCQIWHETKCALFFGKDIPYIQKDTVSCTCLDVFETYRPLAFSFVTVV